MSDAVGGQPDSPIDWEKGTTKLRAESKVFKETNVAGFSHRDPEVGFYSQVAALLRPDDVILDFGAGRGEFFLDDPSRYRAWLQNFRGRCAHVDGVDVDPVVFSNPTLDEAKVFEPGQALPYEDGRFDLVVSRYVLEHVPDPEWAARELLRVTKPGGWICALTPNKWGYVALASRLVPNSWHQRFLRRVQPHRKDEDVFPTAYRLNSVQDIRRHFGAHADIFHYRTCGVPSYHFGSPAMLRALLLFETFLPPAFRTALGLFIRKKSERET